MQASLIFSELVFGAGSFRSMAYSDQYHGGEVIALMGRNGSGKSSFLKTIGGLWPPLEGDVLINGLNINQLTIPLRSNMLTLCFAKQETIPVLKVETYIKIIAKTEHNRNHHFFKDFKQKWEEIEPENNINCFCSELSDGQFKKLNLCIHISLKREVYLFDEPLAFLDYPSKIIFMGWIKTLAAEGKIVVLSIHELPQLEGLGAKIMKIANGKPFQQKTIESLREEF